MENGSFALALVFSIVFTTVLIVCVVAIYEKFYKFANDKTGEWDSPFLNLARRHKGQFVPQVGHGYPRTRFEHNGARVVVDVECRANRKIQACYTRVRIHWPIPLMRCEVYPQNFTRTIGTYRGMSDVLIGVQLFDDRYMITSSDKEKVMTLLRHDARKVIDELYEFKVGNDIYVRISGGEFLVKRPGVLGDRETLDRYVNLCLDLFDACLSTQKHGIEIIAPGDRKDSDPGEPPICQICGDEIVDQSVVCTACETPHHADCWKYYGACSTYGCGETNAK